MVFTNQTVQHKCKYCTNTQNFPRKVERAPQNGEIVPHQKQNGGKNRSCTGKLIDTVAYNKVKGKRSFNKTHAEEATRWEFIGICMIKI